MPVGFATSEYGLWYHELLRDFGKTSDEWGELDPHVRLFHEEAQQEYNQRVKAEHDEYS